MNVKTLLYSIIGIFIWYPWFFGKIPFIYLLVTLLLFYKVFYDKRIFIPNELFTITRLILWLSIIAFLSFIYQTISGLNSNLKVELAVFTTNFLLAPLIFLFVATEKKINIILLIRVLSITTLIFVLMAISRDVGFNLNNFDAQSSRFRLFFANSSLASTSIALPLTYIFAANVYILLSYHKKIKTIVILFFVILSIYIASSRYAILIVLLTGVYYLLYSLKRYNIKAFIGFGIVVLILSMGINIATFNVNDRFLSEVQSFEKVSDPLADKSFLIRFNMWMYAVQDISNHPFGYGYSRFVDAHFEIHPTLGKRGFNTHNEWLLQLLGIGWFGTLIFIAFLFSLFKFSISKLGINRIMPFMIVFIISTMFETYSNSPLSINIYPTFYFLMGILVNSKN